MHQPRFYVYVIELESQVPNDPAAVTGVCDVYVGSSASPPEERFEKHLSGSRGSRHVRKRGVRLRPDLCRGFNPLLTRAAAHRAELHVANALKHRGHRVFGACSRKLTPECFA